MAISFTGALQCLALITIPVIEDLNYQRDCLEWGGDDVWVSAHLRSILPEYGSSLPSPERT
jgi:hypothetical protein